MNPKAFFDAVSDMRLKQMAYRQNRTQETLQAMLTAEKIIDDETARVNNVFAAKAGQQVLPTTAMNPVPPLCPYDICNSHCRERNCDFNLGQHNACRQIYAALKNAGRAMTKDVLQIFER